jgi:undecaprenyl-diphosphatase
MARFINSQTAGSILVVCLLAETVFGNVRLPAEDVQTPAPQRITMPQAMILGTIEGLTEYLPVSSTGHLILAAEALQLGGFAHDQNGDPVHGPFGPIMQPQPAINAFNIVIQFGAILAVVGLYFKRIGEMFRGLIGRDEQGRKLLINLIVAFIPSAIVGLLLDRTIEKYLFSPLTVAIALAVGGVVMISMTRLYRRAPTHIHDVHNLTVRAALMIGLVQCLAMWPGTSRSMVTILAGLGVGLSMVAAAEFSFLLALPTLTAATLYKTVTQWDALTTAAGFDSLITGIVISAIVAALSVRFLIHHLTRHGLAPFGFYRIALAIGVMYYFTR